MAYDSSKPANGGSLVSADIRENFRALKEDGIVIAADLVAAKKDPVAGTAGLRTLGTGAQQAMPGNTSLIPVDGSVSRSKLENRIAGEYLEVSTGGGTVYYGSGWQKIKEIYLPFGGTYRVRFDLLPSESSVTCYAQIYKNYTAYGTAVSTVNNNAAYTQDIGGWSPGDLLQLYLYVVANYGRYATTTYLRLYSGNPYNFYVNL